MKIKKLALLLLTLVLSMTACNSGQAEVDFNYLDIDIMADSIQETLSFVNADEASKIRVNNTEGQEVLQTGISNFEATKEECGDFVGFKMNDGQVYTQDDIGKIATQEEVDAFFNNLSSEIVEEGGAVRITLDVAFNDRDAEVSMVYVSNPSNAHYEGSENPEANEQSEEPKEVIIPFKLSEVTVSPNYSFGEKMAKAGMNTLMGMGSVFIILIFIALIIGQFERLSKALVAIAGACTNAINSIKNGFKKEDSVVEEDTKDKIIAPVASPVVVAPAADDLMNDLQLVAVITAAVNAAHSESTGNPGSDGLIVRSIRKAKR